MDLQQSIAEMMREIQRIHRLLDQREHRQRRSTIVGSKVRDMKRFDRDIVLAATPKEIIVAVKEEPIQEPPLQEEELLFNDEHDEPTIELIGGPRFDPEYEDQQELLQEEIAPIAPIRPPKEEIGVTTTKESWDVIPCMILPAELPNKLALIRENLPVIMKRPLPPRENDRVVNAWTGPLMGRLRTQGGPAHMGPAGAESDPHLEPDWGISGFPLMGIRGIQELIKESNCSPN